MWKHRIFLPIISILTLTLFMSGYFSDEYGKLFLEISGPYVGANYPFELGANGKGIKIGVIDTGINFAHPDFVTSG